jgi:hypothetical protein
VDTNTDTIAGQEADVEHLLQVSGMWTPMPEGYAYNLGAQFVPMPIQGPDGCIWLAQFTKVEFSDDPTVHGFRAGSLLRLVGRSVRRARGGVILKSTTTKGGLLL